MDHDVALAMPHPEMSPKPISPKQREDVIVRMAAGLLGAYRYFREHSGKRGDGMSNDEAFAWIQEFPGTVTVCDSDWDNFGNERQVHSDFSG